MILCGIKLLNALRGMWRHYVFVGQYTTNRNYGDALGVWLPKLLNINRGYILPRRFVFDWQYTRGTNIQMVGSALGDVDEHSIVCGAGAVSSEQLPKAKPAKIVSVRGPLTRDIFLSQGMDCPAVYGDPAMLLPLFYTPINVKKRYKIGLIPHYVDKDSPGVKLLCQNPDIHLIDILLPPNRGLQMSIEKYWKCWVDELCACEYVISSSLHGLILAETYHIPTLWATFSDNINGGTFKYMDYYKSINTITPPRVNFCCKQNMDTSFLIEQATLKDTSAIDKVQYRQLLESVL